MRIFPHAGQLERAPSRDLSSPFLAPDRAIPARSNRYLGVRKLGLNGRISSRSIKSRTHAPETRCSWDTVS
ncbi:hypothetical protein MES4922_520007 [Mesorhizobium ventifaucium]|uniref:Propionyl-coenzyme A carboxylase alpha polypeptide n=1 Tax=Mesorhizobium ventifaucium TaxID=666020 RepID=A0ABM9EBG8_9HYPH|nr:hypothetical protein MES4922_520007 [Mesorhizobium ventifaucium]